MGSTVNAMIVDCSWTDFDAIGELISERLELYLVVKLPYSNRGWQSWFVLLSEW
jgi:hypothetical protein